jgi:6-bladed beta-propeller
MYQRFSMVFLLGVLPAAAYSQGTTLRELNPRPKEIQLLTKVHIGVEEAADLGGVGTRYLSRDSRGLLYNTNLSALGNLLVFDAHGKFLKVAAQTGSGPGEFQSITDVVPTRGDTLHVFDARQRLHVVLTPDFKYVRSDRIPGTTYHGAVLSDGRLILNSIIRTRHSADHPLHTYDPKTGELRSFGEVKSASAPSDAALLRPIQLTGRDSIWTAHKFRYVMQLWTPDGKLLKELNRDVPWFEPYDRRPLPDGKTPPPPTLIDISIDSSGLIWTAVSIPNSDWKKFQTAYYDPNLKRQMFRSSKPGAEYDAIIDVIDPKAGTVVATRRLRQHTLGFAASGHIVFHTTDDAGRESVDIWRLGLSPSAKR